AMSFQREFVMRFFTLCLVAGSLSTGAAWAADSSSGITWDTPSKAPAVQSAPQAQGAAPDRNGIIWDEPGKPASKPAPSATAPQASAPQTLFHAGGADSASGADSNGIVWNTPGKPAAKAPPPPSGGSPPVNAQANAQTGNCREFQTTII